LQWFPEHSCSPVFPQNQKSDENPTEMVTSHRCTAMLARAAQVLPRSHAAVMAEVGQGSNAAKEELGSGRGSGRGIGHAP